MSDECCGTCKYRDETGHCDNREKLFESCGEGKDRHDSLIYDYCEGGGFWVGEKFGCVHHEERQT